MSEYTDTDEELAMANARITDLETARDQALAERDAALALIRRLDWTTNIHTHYGYATDCAVCNFYAILTQSQALATTPSTEEP